MKDRIRISEMLKLLMKQKGLTFKKLSALSTVPESTIKTWSAGVEPKSLSHARKVVRILEVSVEELVFGEKDSSTEVNLNNILTKKIFSGWCKVSIETPDTPEQNKKDK
jgi:transcriptional regulator with XRE-family HTH domain